MTTFYSVASADQRQPARCRYMADFAGAQLYVCARSLGTLLRVEGEIDASNAEDVTQGIRRFARLKTPLVLDLCDLSFLSVEGFRAVLVLNRELQHSRVHCSVVAGEAMRPLLRIVTDNGLPVVGSVPEALQVIEDIVAARRQFLSDLLRNRQRDRHAMRAAAS